MGLLRMLVLSACLAGLNCYSVSTLTKGVQGWSDITRLFGNSVDNYDPDVDLTTPNIIRRHGYPAESHVVETEDGYLLTLHRIPHGRTGPTKRTGPVPSRPAVFMQHGLLASSSDWITTGPGKALAYLLVDAGYDVWLGNARGNTYSRSHATLSVTSAQFWNFSFHEIGFFDLPASIDYILSITGQRRLFYFGHSMGTSVFYAMASTRPAYNEKIVTMFSLAPVAYVTHMKSPIRMLAPWVDDIEFIARILGANEFLPQTKILRLLAKYGCESVATEEQICENALFVLCGYDDQQFNKSLIPIIFSHTPAGTATKVLVHFAQEIRAGKFQQYDLGAKENLKVYNQSSPPEYDLAKISAPVYLLAADNDWLANTKDVAALGAKLPKLLGTYVVPLAQFNHLDFLWGKDAKTLVYDKVLEVMKNVTSASAAELIANESQLPVET